MDEMVSHQWQIFDEKYAVVLNKAVFKWNKDPDISNEVKVEAKGDMELDIKGKYFRLLFVLCKLLLQTTL